MVEPFSSRQTSPLYTVAYQTILDLADEQGIAASSRQEAYGCLFGRDSAISILKLLEVYRKTADSALLAICRRTLLTHTLLQGTSYVIESGEEPGKFVHEFRESNYDRLINRPKPWYVYPDSMLRNYDSVDSTPLLLLAYHRYWQATGDKEFLLRVLPAVEAGLRWLMTDADKDRDFLIEYELSPKRTQHGGLTVQSWTDSHACLASPEGTFPDYPIAAVEVQAIAWAALRTWADFFRTQQLNVDFAGELETFAAALKHTFRAHFLMKNAEGKVVFAYQALDGQKRPIATITPNPLLCLWALYRGADGTQEAVIDQETMRVLVERAFAADLFDSAAGLRTMSQLSPTFDPSDHSYHNGSFWPFLNGLVHEGLVNWGFYAQAELLKAASLLPLQHFGSAIELYCSTEPGVYKEYISHTGKKGCRQQAWTAACMLDWLS